LIIYPLPFSDSRVPLDTVLKLTRIYKPSCTLGGIWIDDDLIDEKLFEILDKNNIPFDMGNTSFSESFRQEVRNHGLPEALKKFNINLNIGDKNGNL